MPNYGKPGKGPLLEEGMVLAVEPMTTAGRSRGARGRRRLGDLLPGLLSGGALRVHGRDHRRRARGCSRRGIWSGSGAAEPVAEGAPARAERRRARWPSRCAGRLGAGQRLRSRVATIRSPARMRGVCAQRASPRPGSGGRNGSQSRVAGTQPPKGIMKVRPSVKPMCEKCKIIRRHGVVLVICQNKRHKQRQG